MKGATSLRAFAGTLLLALMSTATAGAASNPASTNDVTRLLQVALQQKTATAPEIKRLNNLAHDSYNDFDPECATYTGSCLFGKTDSKKKVLLLGDSHAQMWLPAVIGTFGKTFSINVQARYECPVASVATRKLNGTIDSGCPTWRAAEITSAVNNKPDVIILAENTFQMKDLRGNLVTGAAWESGLRETLTRLRPSGARIIVLGDAPSFNVNPSTCLMLNTRDVQQCTQTVDPGAPQGQVAAERSAAAFARVGFIDTGQWSCLANKCPGLIGGRPVYFNGNHFTVSFVQLLQKPFTAAVMAAVKKS